MDRYQKFQESKQAAVKLDIALEDFFQEEVPQAHREAYGQYLRQRIRPAVEALIRREDLERLEYFHQQGWLPPVDDFLKLAAREQKNAAFVWLLRIKQERYGFTEENFSL